MVLLITSGGKITGMEFKFQNEFQEISDNFGYISQGPHSQILMTGGGGGNPTEVHNLHPKKSQLQNLSTQKITDFFSITKKIP